MNNLVSYGSSDSEDSDLGDSANVTSGKYFQANLKTDSQGSKTDTQASKTNNASKNISHTITDTNNNVDKKLDISDEEDNYVPRSKSPPRVSNDIVKQINKAEIVKVDVNSLQSREGSISLLLPAPKQQSVKELELESFQKSKNKRMKKDKRKIFALNLDDFEDETKEEEKDKPKLRKPETHGGKCSLFSILPKPSKSVTAIKSTKSVVPKSAVMKPRTLKRKTSDESSAQVDDALESESDFFSFEKSEKERVELDSRAKSIKLETLAAPSVIF